MNESEISERMHEKAKQMRAFEPMLKLSDGEEFFGTIVGWQPSPFNNGPKKLCVVEDAITHARFGLPTHVALYSQLDSEKAEVGNHILIQASASVLSENNKTYYGYTVVIDQ